MGVHTMSFVFFSSFIIPRLSCSFLCSLLSKNNQRLNFKLGQGSNGIALYSNQPCSWK